MLPNRGVPRLLRGAMLAGCSAALGVAAHAAAGGGVPDTLPVVALTLGFGALGIGLAGQQRGVLAILLVLGLAQLGMHLTLNLSMHGMGGGGDSMIAAHVLATLVSAVLLAWAEHAVFALVKALCSLLPRRIPPLRPLAVTVLLLAVPQVDRLLRAFVCGSVSRRGPPVPC